MSQDDPTVPLADELTRIYARVTELQKENEQQIAELRRLYAERTSETNRVRDVERLLDALIVSWRVGVRALDIWGPDAQRDVAIGELAELIAELAQEGRGRHTEETVVEELADAFIVLMQQAAVFGPPRLTDAIWAKTGRLQERIDAEPQPILSEIGELEERLMARHGLNLGQLRRLEGKPDNQRQLLALLHAWDDNPDEMLRVISGVPYDAQAVAR